VFKPSPALPVGVYTVAVHADGVDANGADNPKAFGAETFDFYVNNSAPVNLSRPAFINNVNLHAVPFSGTAAPGLKVTVTIVDNLDQTGQSDASGSQTVPGCNAAPVCPWQLAVDAGSLNGDGNPADGPDGHLRLEPPPQPTPTRWQRRQRRARSPSTRPRRPSRAPPPRWQTAAPSFTCRPPTPRRT